MKMMRLNNRQNEHERVRHGTPILGQEQENREVKLRRSKANGLHRLRLLLPKGPVFLRGFCGMERKVGWMSVSQVERGAVAMFGLRRRYGKAEESDTQRVVHRRRVLFSFEHK